MYMKKINAIIFVFVLCATFSVFADYNECTPENNFCGETIYRCDLYCANGNYNYSYCTQNCNWYSNWSTNQYLSINSDTNNYQYNTISGNSGYSSNIYPNIVQSWDLSTQWLWSDEDLHYMTQMLNNTSLVTPQQNTTDFFATRVIGKDNNWKKLQAINVKNILFKSTDIQERLENSKIFISALKNAIWERYTNGIIGDYQIADIIQNLSDTAYHLNTYFINEKHYEKTKNNFYNDLAIGNLNDVTMSYSQLKWSLLFRQ